MIAGYENAKVIRNQYGVEIPICLIKADKDTRHKLYQEMYNEGYQSPYEVRGGQEFWKRYFKLHKKLFHTEHEANMCMSDNEVYKMLCKNKYLAAKARIEKAKYGVTLVDMPEDFIYRGARIYTYYDDNGKLDKESSYIKVYDVHPALHDAHQTIEFELHELSKIQSTLNSIPNEIKNKKGEK